ncbi:BrnT family toxin [Tumidithrix elongata RA019]|uniref:BrnT family toxin n=1 Tax=Tumidithrix elongata BACA0141 TaxID=2716417 RepID=A0AAW9Q5L1_9CYAN|nr:BrnT family toxin [Tumidithrix elongata RA019]
MEVEWDPNKAATNLQKHGVRFSDAESVLFDPMISARSATRSERQKYESGI